MKISIIIPIYNVENYLADCLDSILNQNIEQIEILCIEDASTDNSKCIVEWYVEHYENINMYCNVNNKGLSYSRNVGLHNAKGKYVIFLDSDDMLKNNSLNELYRIAEQDELEAVFFDTELLYEEGVEKNKDTYKEKRKYYYKDIYTGEEIFREFNRNGDWDPCVWRQFWLREYLLSHKIQFIEGIFHEDNPFTFVSILQLQKCACVNKSYHIYRRRNNSIMGEGMNEKKIADRIIGLALMLEFWITREFENTTNVIISDYFVRMIHWSRYLIKENNFEIEKIGKFIGNELGKCLLFSCTEKEVYIKISEESKKLLKRATKIIIYGAGKAARSVIEYCDKNDIVVDEILVTNKENNTHSLLGHRIRDIYSYSGERGEGVVVIIAIKNILLQKEIRENLENMGFESVVIV